MYRLLMVGLAACAPQLQIHERAKELHDRGINYLDLALASANDNDRRRLCDHAEQSCRNALEYDDRWSLYVAQRL